MKVDPFTKKKEITMKSTKDKTLNHGLLKTV